MSRDPADPSPPRRRDEERDLLHRLIHKEAEAWEEFLACYGDLIYGHIYHTLRRYDFRIPQDEIADWTQELLLRLLADEGRRLRSFEGREGCTLAGWLRIVCTHHAVDLIRSRRGTVSTDLLSDEELHHLIQSAGSEAEDSVQQKIDAEETVKSLMEAVQALPVRDRLIFQLYYQDERPRDEIAERLRLEPNAVDQALYRMRAKLKDLLLGRGET